MFPTPLKAALIDMDGVLYDSMPFHARAWHKMMLEETGLDLPLPLFFEYEGMTGRATIELIFKEKLGKTVSEDECRRLYAIKTQYFVKEGKKVPMPGADKVLAELERIGATRVLVTGSGQSSLLDSLDRDYPRVFSPDKLVTARNVTRGKPDPEPYLKGLAKANADASQTIVIENAPLGIMAGKSAGCNVMAVATGPIAIEKLLNAGAEEVFDSMNELARRLKCIPTNT